MEIIRVNKLVLLFEEGMWILQKKSKTYPLDSGVESPFMYWLPLLESNPEDTIDQINSNLAKLGFDESFESSFPINAFIKNGLGSNSLYWINYTLDWVEYLYEIVDVSKELEALITLPIMKKQQRIKSRVYKLLRMYRPSGFGSHLANRSMSDDKEP